ncbi:MAG: RNA-guided pseudouridylation complex pseudouridine synthase subunit Cbf5 [Candidatus Woesearchaeota archaeon]|jgi:H/ACA ribonucleoprotein complex subunit 4
METLLPFEKIKREVFVRKLSETSPKYGKKPDQRTTKELIHLGIVNIDKPAGPTSHQVSGYVKQILHLNKAGHSGTLDPNVTGVLPVALSDATKVVQALLPAGKEYVCLMHLHDDYSEEQIRKTCALFIGKIKQLPPLKSAVKREWRYRKIYYLNVHEIDGRDVLFTVGCQAGTYIRRLCTDIGKALGSNAHMQELRRTKAAIFSESTLCTMQDVADAFFYYKKENNDLLIRKYIQPMENAVAHLAKIWILDTSVDTLCHGASLKVRGISKVESDIQIEDFVAIMTLKGELVAFGKALMISKDMQKKDSGIAVKVERVFMNPGVYPRIDVPN